MNNLAKIKTYITLARFDMPAGYNLLFLPCIFGMLLAQPDLHDFIYYALLYWVGSIIMHGTGSIINDIIDKDLDAKVARTKLRPIASAQISVKNAIIYNVVLLVIAFIILMQLSNLAIIIALSSMILVVSYPFMKRITNWPQAFLGITFNLGAIIGYANITEKVSYGAILVYIGCIFWTLTYDTIYAFMDTEDDVKAGIKSSALSIKDYNYKLIIMLFCSLFIGFLTLGIYVEQGLNLYSMIIILVAYLIMLWIILNLNIALEKECLARFSYNQYIGILIVFGMLINTSYK